MAYDFETELNNAARWCIDAAMGGFNWIAFYYIGRRYDAGIGTEEDQTKASWFFMQALRIECKCMRNNCWRGKDNTASCICRKTELSEEEAMALSWMYAHGKGVKKDMQKMALYCFIARELQEKGLMGATEKRERVAAQMII